MLAFHNPVEKQQVSTFTMETSTPRQEPEPQKRKNPLSIEWLQQICPRLNPRAFCQSLGVEPWFDC